MEELKLMNSSLAIKAQAGAKRLLKECGNAQPHDKILIVFDSISEQAAKIVFEVAQSLGLNTTLAEAPVAGMHGQEPPHNVAKLMTEATLVLGLTSKSMAHTKARIQAASSGARYLSLPEYSTELLADPSLQTNFRDVAKTVRKISDFFSNGKRVRVTSPNGTDLTLNIEGRTGNYCPGFVEKAGELGSPPDIEANVSPVETDSDGVLIADGSIPYPGLGLLQHPVRLMVRNGRIAEMSCPNDPTIVTKLEELFSMHDPLKTKVLAELGLGLNEHANLTGIMLTDEGAAVTGHFGFGANSTVGGKNSVPFHLDFVFRSPSIEIDGKLIMKDGVVLP